ncbi:MAG TPA: DegT/DnrJ/EryC1/StrS aminotransferase family protein [Turneriella sp.]|nr:DegT/DnrJ/EryC1/StrS aminotransferase family protein [Turneriella sp.]
MESVATHTASRAKNQPIQYLRPTLSRNELKSVLESLVLEEVSFGQGVLNFEKAFARTFDFNHAAAVDSYTSAFHLALIACDLAKDDEIILPVSSPLAMLDAIHYTGARPVVIDLAKDSFHADVDTYLNAITERTKIIFLPYTFGSYKDYSTLYEKLSVAGLRKPKERYIRLIEDISHTIGHEFHGRQAGENADIAIAGLNEDHLMTIGKGGVVLTDSHNHFAVIKDLRVQGGNRPYRMRFDYAITDYQAAMGMEQLGNLSAMIERRRRIGGLYNEAMEKSRLKTYFTSPDADVCGSFPIVSETDLAHTQSYFASLHIETRRIFPNGPLHQIMGLNVLNFPNAERLYQRGVMLPLYPMLNKPSVEKITAAIRGFY